MFGAIAKSGLLPEMHGLFVESCMKIYSITFRKQAAVFSINKPQKDIGICSEGGRMGRIRCVRVAISEYSRKETVGFLISLVSWC